MESKSKDKEGLLYLHSSLPRAIFTAHAVILFPRIGAHWVLFAFANMAMLGERMWRVAVTLCV